MHNKLKVAVLKPHKELFHDILNTRHIKKFSDKCLIKKLTEIECTTETFCSLIETNAIHIVQYNIGGKYYSIIIDEDGIFNGGLGLTAVSLNNIDTIRGTIVIAGDIGKDGNMIDLTEDDLANINKSLSLIFHPIKQENGPMLYEVIRILSYSC